VFAVPDFINYAAFGKGHDRKLKDAATSRHNLLNPRSNSLKLVNLFKRDNIRLS
jgi:hypothetical protein